MITRRKLLAGLFSLPFFYRQPTDEELGLVRDLLTHIWVTEQNINAKVVSITTTDESGSPLTWTIVRGAGDRPVKVV